MKMNQPEGNYYDKYGSKNIIVQELMKGFFRAYAELLSLIPEKPEKILEAGCGEGEVTRFVYNRVRPKEMDAFDISNKVIEIAKNHKVDIGLMGGGIKYTTGSLYNIESRDYDLVICSEVLEHLDYPKEALKQLKKATNKYLLLSVPNEPIWRILNMLRGKYIRHMGNTPGHVNHWSKKEFINFLLDNGVTIVKTKSPLPWTVVLAMVETECARDLD